MMVRAASGPARSVVVRAGGAGGRQAVRVWHGSGGSCSCHPWSVASPTWTAVRVCSPPQRVVLCPPAAAAACGGGPLPCCAVHPGATPTGHRPPCPSCFAAQPPKPSLTPPSALHHVAAPPSPTPPSAQHHDAQAADESPEAKPLPPAEVMAEGAASAEGGKVTAEGEEASAEGGEAPPEGVGAPAVEGGGALPTDPLAAATAAAAAAAASPPPGAKQVVPGPSISVPPTAPAPAPVPEQVAEGLPGSALGGDGDDDSGGANAAAAAAAIAAAATAAAAGGSSSSSMSSLSSTTASSSSVSSSSSSSSSDSLSGLAARAAALAGVPPPPASLSPLPRYGFCRAFSGRFPPERGPATYAAVALPYPDSVAERQRRAVRLAAEDEQFDPEHYAADYMLPGDHEDALTVPPPFDERPSLSAGEQLLLSRFPHTTGVPDAELHRVLAGIVCAVWAWAYDRRVSGGGGGVEAWWNLATLSPVFSFLDDEFFDIGSALDAVARRSLAYPIIRSVRMVRAVCADTAAVFRGDTLRVRERLVRVLLDVYTALLDGEGCSDVAEMFVSPYLSWVMDEGGMSPGELARLCDLVARYSWNARSVGWDLRHIETLARRVARDDPGLTEGTRGAMESDAAAAGAAAAVILSTAAAAKAAERAEPSASAPSRPGPRRSAAGAPLASTSPQTENVAAAVGGDIRSSSDSASLLSVGSCTCSSYRSGPDTFSSGYTDTLSVDSSGDSAFHRRAQVAIEGVRRG